MRKPFAVFLVRVEDDYYLKLNPDDTIAAAPSVKEGVAAVEEAFNRKHATSYEGSMSACVHAMFFGYSLVEAKSVEDLKAKLLDPTIPDSEHRIYSLQNVAGYMRGLKADRKKAARIWKAAQKPALITEGVNAMIEERKRREGEWREWNKTATRRDCGLP